LIKAENLVDILNIFTELSIEHLITKNQLTKFKNNKETKDGPILLIYDNIDQF